MPRDYSSENEAEVRELIRTIYAMRSRAKNGWLPWRWVAKEQKGSEEHASILSSRATMEPWKRYFSSSDKGVKLTEEGVRYAETIAPPKLSKTEEIADSVRKYASRLRNISLNIKHVSKVAQVGQRYVQALSVEASDEGVASETPCEFRPRNGESITYGRVIGQEPDGGVLYVALDSEVFESSLPAYLSIDRAYLLNQLAGRLRELKELPIRMAVALRTHDSVDPSAIANRDSLHVAALLAGLPTPWTRFLWGPPGAGKTFGLGYLVARLLEKEPNSKTLIVAPSNRAVDVAMEQLVVHVLKSEKRNALSDRELLRFGYPRKQQILDRPELLGSPVLDELTNKVKSLSAQIHKAERERNNQQEIAVLRTEMLAAQEAVKNAVEAHIGQCRVVATTTTLAYLTSSPICRFKWDNVIIDEVTMVTPAMCTFLASLATQRFLMASDPQQLGPVYENSPNATKEDFEWMGRDIFEKSGVSSGDGEKRRVRLEDKRLARITAQRRCTTDIWTRVKHLYPEVKNLADEEQRKHLLALPPCSGSSVVLLDTSRSTEVALCRNQYGSWENPFTAELALEVASAIAAEAPHPLSIAIIAPYRAQVRLLRKWIRHEQRATRSPFNRMDVDAGTVHQFQGSDADVIIFDMVDGEGRPKIGNLLRNDTGLRLVNVAFTRARGKLVLIADKNWCGKAMQKESNALLRQLVLEDKTVTRIDVLPRPNIAAQLQRPVGCLAEELLWNALCRRSDLPDVKAGFILRSSEAIPPVTVDFAFPEVKFAVYLDGPRWSLIAGEWQCDWRQRHNIVEAGWAFCVFSIAEVHEGSDACAEEIAALIQKHISGGQIVTK